MAGWRIISRSYLKYASYQLTRNYSRTSLTHGVKQTKLCSLDIPNSDICRKPSHIFENVRFLATSAQTRKKGEEVESGGPRLNEKITAETVRLVSKEGHCVVSLKEALRRAKELECDLVEVQRDAVPPVCKIVDYSHEKYKKAKVGKERAKAKRAETTIRPDVKEIRFTPKIEAKDLVNKAKQALRLMESGYRVKCHAVPDKDKKKELEPEKLLELLSRFTSHIEEALVEFGPEADRGSAVVVVRHAKFGPPKKGKAIKLKEMNIKTAARIKEESPNPDSSEAGGSTIDDSGDIETSEPKLDAKQVQPVQVQNRYSKREPSNEVSGGRDANRFEPRSPNQPVNPQRPRFSNQQPSGRFDPNSPNEPSSAPRPRSPDQAPNQQPFKRFEPRSPNQPLNPQRLPFPDQPSNQQPAPNRQGPPPPQFQNQPPSRFEPPPPNPPRAPPRQQTRLPNETQNQQPSSGPASSYGIFSIPKTK